MKSAEEQKKNASRTQTLYEWMGEWRTDPAQGIEWL